MLGILPGLVGVIQATEAIKLILGKGESLIGRLLLVDALNMRFRELKLRKNPECPVCGSNPTVTQLIDYQQFCGIVPETPQEKAVKNGIPQITVKELKRRIDAGEDVFICSTSASPTSTRSPRSAESSSRRTTSPTAWPRSTATAKSSSSAAAAPAPSASPSSSQQSGYPERRQPRRRHPGLGRRDRPQSAEVLSQPARPAPAALCCPGHTLLLTVER